MVAVLLLELSLSLVPLVPLVSMVWSVSLDPSLVCETSSTTEMSGIESAMQWPWPWVGDLLVYL